MFDSSGEPTGLRWTASSRVNGRRRADGRGENAFLIPEKLAYDGKQAPYGLLVFDVELIKIE
jgi:hypothetical protein